MCRVLGVMADVPFSVSQHAPISWAGGNCTIEWSGGENFDPFMVVLIVLIPAFSPTLILTQFGSTCSGFIYDKIDQYKNYLYSRGPCEKNI